MVKKEIMPKLRYKLYAYSESCLLVELIKFSSAVTMVSMKYGMCGRVKLS